MDIPEDLRPLVYQESATVGGYDVGRDALITVPRMVEAMHQASIAQVLTLKLSALELAEVDLTWVLVQQHLEVVKQPMLGEQFQILTHPSGKDRLYTYRDFHLEDKLGNGLAHASSTWILMNTKSRRVGKYPSYVSNFLEPSNQFDALPRAPRLHISLEESEHVHSHRVAFHDLDFNGHLSNHCYFKWMLDSIPEKIFDHKRLQSFNIRFKEEAQMGEKISVCIRQVGPEQFQHTLFKQNVVIAIAESHWNSVPIIAK